MQIKPAQEKGYYVKDFQGKTTLHSPVNPYREARQLFPDKFRPEARPILVGAGLGYRLNELAELLTPPRALVLEPFPELLQRGRELEIWTPEDYEQLVIIEPGQEELLAHLENFLPLETYNRWELIDWPKYRQLAPDFFRKMKIQLEGLNHYHEINLLTLRNRGQKWLEQTRQLLPLLPETNVPTPESFQGPVAVVGAGPSLDKQLPWLRKNREHLNVVAINTAGPILAKANVEVDLHFAADADEKVYEDLAASQLNHLLVSPAVNPAVVHELDVPFTLMVLTSPFTDWMFGAPFLTRGAASSAASPTLVKWLLDKPVSNIYLLGMDLESRRGRYYARGTGREEKVREKLNRFYTLPGWHQEKIKREYSGRHSQLETQQRWLEFLGQQFETIQAVKPEPRWWSGNPAPDNPEGQAEKFCFKSPDEHTTKKWLHKQYEYFRALRSGGETTRAWQRYLFWLKELITDWEKEYERWRQSFRATLQKLN